MSNTLLSPTVITKAALAILHNRTGIARNCNRTYESRFGTPKIGTSLSIRLPNQFKVTDGPGLSVQDVTEQSVPIVVDTQKHVDFAFLTSELTLTLDEFADRYIRPAVARLASEMDKDLGTLYTGIYNAVGTPGTTPNAPSFFTDAQNKLDDNAAPNDGNRAAVLNPAAHWSMMAAMPNTALLGFNRAAAERMGNEGEFLRDFFGLMMDRSHSIPSHTVGLWDTGSTGITNGAGQTGASLVTDGWAVSTAILKKGDVFTIAAVFQVNPETKISTGVLQQFVATADVSSDGGGNATIPMSPSIVISGATQNVDAAAADGKALVIKGTESAAYPQNLVMHRDAIALVNVPLEMPDGVDFKAQEQFEGFNLRVLRQYDINTDRVVCRIDGLWGKKLVRPELACRLFG